MKKLGIEEVVYKKGFGVSERKERVCVVLLLL